MSAVVDCPAAPDRCLCCVCLLRRSEEFGSAFDATDECCEGCHGDMAADGWPGWQCADVHACGHVGITPGCGGCDPSAIDFVIDDHGTRRPFEPARDLTTRPAHHHPAASTEESTK